MDIKSSGSAGVPVGGSTVLKRLNLALVVGLWLLPAWLVWLVISRPDMQIGLADWQIAVLAWYPLIAILMLYFATVLYRRLPKTWLGLAGYLIGAILLPGLHWWLSGVGSPKLLVAEWATFSLTLFVMGFSIELFRRILVVARANHWMLVIFGGLANLTVFVVPGVLIATSLYVMLYQQGLFRGNILSQAPYLLGLSIAIWHDWRSFKTI
jgi:hypothetical protein